VTSFPRCPNDVVVVRGRLGNLTRGDVNVMLRLAKVAALVVFALQDVVLNLRVIPAASAR